MGHVWTISVDCSLSHLWGLTVTFKHCSSRQHDEILEGEDGEGSEDSENFLFLKTNLPSCF